MGSHSEVGAKVFEPDCEDFLELMSYKYGGSYATGLFLGILSTVCQGKFALVVPNEREQLITHPLTTFSISFLSSVELNPQFFDDLVEPLLRCVDETEGQIKLDSAVLINSSYDDLKNLVDEIRPVSVSLLSRCGDLVDQIDKKPRVLEFLNARYDDKPNARYGFAHPSIAKRPTLLSFAVYTRDWSILDSDIAWNIGFNQRVIPLFPCKSLIYNRYESFSKQKIDEKLELHLNYYRAKIHELYFYEAPKFGYPKNIQLANDAGALYCEMMKAEDLVSLPGVRARRWLKNCFPIILKVATLFSIYEDKSPADSICELRFKNLYCAINFVARCAQGLMRSVNIVSPKHADSYKKVLAAIYSLCHKHDKKMNTINNIYNDNAKTDIIFSFRDIYRNAHLKKEDAEYILNLLINSGYLQEYNFPYDAGKKGRPRGRTFIVDNRRRLDFHIAKVLNTHDASKYVYNTFKSHSQLF